MDFKKYRRTQIAEMREVTQNDVDRYNASTKVNKLTGFIDWDISISAEDLRNGSPKLGDMIARNPDNHSDKWLVAKEYFSKNFEEL